MNTYNSKISSKKKKISEYSIDETIIKDGSEYIYGFGFPSWRQQS
jgi:hypothetical protein